MFNVGDIVIHNTEKWTGEIDRFCDCESCFNAPFPGKLVWVKNFIHNQTQIEVCMDLSLQETINPEDYV